MILLLSQKKSLYRLSVKVVLSLVILALVLWILRIDRGSLSAQQESERTFRDLLLEYDTGARQNEWPYIITFVKPLDEAEDSIWVGYFRDAEASYYQVTELGIDYLCIQRQSTNGITTNYCTPLSNISFITAVPG